jgi:hypothetical protein
MNIKDQIIEKQEELIKYSYHFLQIDDTDDMKKIRRLESELASLKSQALQEHTKVGPIGLNNVNAEIGIQIAEAMKQKKGDVIIVNTPFSLAPPTLPEPMPIFPMKEFVNYKPPLTRKERRKLKREQSDSTPDLCCGGYE